MYNKSKNKRIDIRLNEKDLASVETAFKKVNKEHGFERFATKSDFIRFCINYTVAEIKYKGIP